MEEDNNNTETQNIEKILICYICKKPIESSKANFDLINRVAVHLKEKQSIDKKLKNIFSKKEGQKEDCTLKYVKTISATGREISFKEVNIDDIFRHHRELFVVINEQELPDPKKS